MTCDSGKGYGSLGASSAPWVPHSPSWGMHTGAETAHGGSWALVQNPSFC